MFKHIKENAPKRLVFRILFSDKMLERKVIFTPYFAPNTMEH